MQTIHYDLMIIAVLVILIVVLIVFIRKLSREKKELQQLEEQNAIKMREQQLNDRLANDRRR